jgi:uncharacterized protein
MSPVAPDGAGRTRIVLRPYGNPLPLGFLSFAVGMALLGGAGLGWLSSPQEIRSAGVLMAAFAFPLELVAAVAALVARDTAAATALGLFTTSWLGLGLLNVLDPTAVPNRTVGLFLAAFAIMLVPLAVTAASGKVLLALVLSVSIIRAGLQAAYELGAPHWSETADGVTCLILLVLAGYCGAVFLAEDARRATGPVPRRGRAGTAMTDPPAEQVLRAPPEPGVREQI